MPATRRQSSSGSSATETCSSAAKASSAETSSPAATKIVPFGTSGPRVHAEAPQRGPPAAAGAGESRDCALGERLRQCGDQQRDRDPAERPDHQPEPPGFIRGVGDDRGRREDGHGAVDQTRARACLRDEITPSSTAVKGSPSFQTTTGAPARSYSSRRASRRSSQSRYASSPEGPGGGEAKGTGEISTITTSIARARRSSKARIARSSRSGVSAITSAFGGSVPRGSTSISFQA